MHHTFVFALVSTVLKIMTVAASENLQNDRITGQTLDDVGTKYNMTLLRVIGKAIKHLESKINQQAKELCRQHPCGEWTLWSDCDVSADNYRRVGAKVRSRECERNTTNCRRYGIPRKVTDYKLCENGFTCPNEYTFTKHGFCLRYYPGPKTWDDAESTCRNDGGHLVRVDSEMKAKDVNDTLLALSQRTSDRVWISGRRVKQAGPWSYGYKAIDPAFTFWGDNDPDNGPTELCMLYNKVVQTSNRWRWFDMTCNTKYQFICQIAAN